MSESSLKDIVHRSEISEDGNARSELESTTIETENLAREDTMDLRETWDEEIINTSRPTDSMMTAREELSYSLNSLDEQWWEKLEFPSGGDTTYFTAQQSMISLVDLAAHEGVNSLHLSNESWWDALSDPEENPIHEKLDKLKRRWRFILIFLVVLFTILLIVGFTTGGVLGYVICLYLH